MKVIKAYKVETFFDKLTGYLSIKTGYPILFSTRYGIHTFGMKFAIDVLVLDNQKRIIKIKRSLPPWRLYFWNPRYSKILEAPEGFIQKSGFQLGDTIRVVPVRG
ncbi:DUF192 domain-containing protein [Candidatus Gottesmanbacteria bacterium]|nr:DUF192 domain-containing protein [Candidatus Gottesmanbacteria bacterium]